MRKVSVMFGMLSLTACAGKAAIVMIPPAACNKLIPTSWHAGVEAPPVPANAPIAEMLGKPLTAQLAAQIAAPWANGYVMASNAIDKANGRTSDTIDIVAECERQANAARPK